MNALRALRLGFAGTPQFAIPALEALVSSRHLVAAVFTQPDRPAGRGQTLHASAVKQRALELGLPVHQPAGFKTGDAGETLRNLNLDALVVVAYGLILPPAILAIPRLGCFNIHASLLPRWRGAAPIQRALLAGDARTGVTIMRMEPALDTGPILASRAVQVAERDTGGTLHDRLAGLGAGVIVETLDALAGGVSQEHPQSQSGVTYADKITKAEARIDWGAAAPEVLRRVRAFNPWPIAETTLAGAQLRVWEADLAPVAEFAAAPGTVVAASSGGIDVACGRGALRILRLQLAGRKALAAQEFIKSRPVGGARFCEPMKNPAAGVRSVAAYAVARILREGVTLDAALHDALAAAPATLGPAVRSLSYGAVRGYFRHEALLAKLLSQPVRSLEPLVRAILSVALFELEDARTPQYAVVDAAVGTAKATDAVRASGLINAVLRRYLRERAALDADIARNPVTRHAAPIWLADRYRADWPVRWTQLLAAGDTQAPMWLRVNSRRASTQSYLEQLRAAGIGAHAQSSVPLALVLDVPCDVRELPEFDAGWVSVQDLGAQCVSFPLALAPGQRVLDACAAPGGKTALIAEREPQLAALVAVDLDPQRLLRVKDNLARGELQADVVLGDAAAPAAWWDGVPFDRILLDAPCSALGVIRRHPDIRLRKSPSEIDKLPLLQARLLTSAWRMLKSGGRLVYATCTVTRSENRDVIAAFLGGTPDALLDPLENWPGWPGFGETDGFGRQILPGEAGADGFYYAALTKQ